MKTLRLLLIPAICTLSACHYFSMEKDNVAKPVALAPIKAEKKVAVAWRAHPGKGAGKRYLKLPPAMEGRLVYSANANGLVSANDVKTGETKWQLNTQLPLSTGPAVSDNAIIIGTAQGSVVALDKTNGAKKWQVQVSNEVLATPTIADNRVFIKTIDSQLYALSTDNGKQIWTYRSESPNIILRASSAVKVEQGIVVAGFSNGLLMAFKANNGQLIWELPISSPRGGSLVDRMVDIDADPIIDGNTIYAASYQGNLTAVNLQRGLKLWEHKLSSFTGMAIDSSKIYVSDDLSRVWSFDKDSGRVLWKQNGLYGRNLTAPSVMGNSIVVADGLGYVHWLSRDNGRFVGRVFNGKAGISAPVVVSGQAAIVDANNGAITKYQIS